jgi:hypothetical protein
MPEMDENLSLRYTALFETYEPRDSFAALVKSLVESAESRHAVSLRPDARYFLLVNFVEMILRPYAETISGLLTYREFTLPHTIVQIEKALDIIMKDLPVQATSAHDVMQVIDTKWDQLTVLLGWG